MIHAEFQVEYLSKIYPQNQNILLNFLLKPQPMTCRHKNFVLTILLPTAEHTLEKLINKSVFSYFPTLAPGIDIKILFIRMAAIIFSISFYMKCNFFSSIAA